MPSSQAALKKIVFIGGTGAQGRAILQHLSALNEYRLLVITRSLTGRAAQELSKLANIELVESHAPTGYDLDAFLTAAKRSDYAFINTDGFAVGEIAETYWGIRLFEVAREAGIKHFVYSGLDYLGRESLYEADKHYVGHYMGKARVQGTLLHYSHGRFNLQPPKIHCADQAPCRVHTGPANLAHELDDHQLWPVYRDAT